MLISTPFIFLLLNTKVIRSYKKKPFISSLDPLIFYEFPVRVSISFCGSLYCNPLRCKKIYNVAKKVNSEATWGWMSLNRILPRNTIIGRFLTNWNNSSECSLTAAAFVKRPERAGRREGRGKAREKGRKGWEKVDVWKLCISRFHAWNIYRNNRECFIIFKCGYV